MTGVDPAGRLRRVPNAPKTPVHGFRIPESLYREAKGYAEDEGVTLSDVVRACLDRYVARERGRRRREGTGTNGGRDE